MKKLNRLLALLLVFVFCFALLPVGALAEETDGDPAGGEGTVFSTDEKKGEGEEKSSADDEKDDSVDKDEDDEVLLAKNAPTGNGQEPQRSGLADEGWYFSFTEGDVSYAIAFYEPWANNTYGLSSGANKEYSPYETTCFSRELSFGVVSKNDQNQATPVDQSFQERITDLTFSFSGTNEDNADGENNWTFAPDAAARKVTITADNKKGFSGTLTASFSFDGEQKELRVPIAYHRSAHYLSFAPEGSEALTGQIQLAPNTPMSGTLYLNSWNAADSAYTAAALTQSESDKFSCEGAVSLSWEESGLATLNPNGTGWFQINYNTESIWANITGNVGSGGGGNSAWFIPVTVGDASYEIEFYMDWGNNRYGPFPFGGNNYKPDSMNGFGMELLLGAVSRSDPNDEWSTRVPADQSVQALITDLSFSFTGQNEDGAAGDDNWTFTPDTGARRVTFSAPGKQGFLGTLTASFRFNGGEMSTVSAEVHYLREEAFLSFEPTDSPAVTEISMMPGEALSGTLYLNQWNSNSHEYVARALTQSDSAKLSADGSASLSWEADLLTITPSREGWFQIIYSDQTVQPTIWTSISVNVGSGGHGGGGNWRIPVTVGDDAYEIAFYQIWGNGGPDPLRGETVTRYRQTDQHSFSQDILFGVLSADNPNDEWSERSLADGSVQDLITDLSFSFDGRNEDNTEGQNWTFTPDTEGRKVTLSAPCKKGFRGTLTASFRFNGGEETTLSVQFGFCREEQYLTFVREGSTAHESHISLGPDEPLSGTLYLNRWDADEKTYTVTPLTGSDLDTYLKIKDGPKSMKIAWTADGLITFTPDGNDWCYFEYEDRANNIMAGIVVEAGTGGLNIFDSVPLIYNGETVNAAPGVIEDGVLTIGTGFGDVFEAGSGKPSSWDFVLGAMKNYGSQANQTFADPGFFDRILSCSVELKMNSGSASDVTVSTPQKAVFSAVGGAELFSFQLVSAPETPFNLSMTVSFTYREDDGEITTHEISATVFFEEYSGISVGVDDLDTTEKLNWVLASNANLEDYLQRNQIDFNWKGGLILCLPPVEYDGLIESHIAINDQWWIELEGTEDDRHRMTAMHGLRDYGGLGIVNSIVFTASPSVTQSWDGENFTCGVLCTGGDGMSFLSTSIMGIMNCSFSGFDYAVRGTRGGYPGSLLESTVSNCSCGLYIDCPNLNAGGNSLVRGNTFIDCGDAVRIVKLPYVITAYDYRIFDNIFVSSSNSDINVSQAGTFFCYGNFFGSSFDARRSALLVEENGAHIVANPCRASVAQVNSNAYWIDPALPTEILITEAGELLISPDAFTGEKIRIDVVDLVDDDLALQGTWTFGG